MKVEEPVVYKTEVELCADFIEHCAKPASWVAYAETGGYDMVLVARDGTQLGIQAKLRFNLKLICQIVEQYETTGPDFRAVLIPEDTHEARVICKALGVVLIGGWRWDRKRWNVDLREGQHWQGGWHWWNPTKRLKLPEYVPDVPAGASGPAQLTDWKVRAMRLRAVLEVRGWVSRTTFRELLIDPRIWTGVGGWLVPDVDVPGRYKAGTNTPDFSEHPKVYRQILMEVRDGLATGKWRPEGEPQKGLLA